MKCHIISFGFKYGIPDEANLVFDVRFVKNPFYVEELRPMTGCDKEVRDYIFANPKAQAFVEKLKEMLDFLIPDYDVIGKSRLVIAIGCTGGRHRSVAFANALYERLKLAGGYDLQIEHRDIQKDAQRGQ